MPSNPTAFVSYSWDDESHKEWVRDLAVRLRADGIAVVLDQWETVPGDQLPAFMERSIRDNSFVLVICTPRYKAKSDRRAGGVGYEGDVMTAEVYSKANHRKFIPLWREGNWEDAAPSWLAGKYRVDLTGTSYSEVQYTDLLSTLHGHRPVAPPVGQPFSTISPLTPSSPAATSTPGPYDAIRIIGVIVDEVTRPRWDGTRGSALYAVPFRLSRTPESSWTKLFQHNWNQPAHFSTMHRAGIVRFSGAKIILDGTTLEEIELHHRSTLKLALDETNRQFAEITRKHLRDTEESRIREEAHRRDVEERAKRLKFD